MTKTVPQRPACAWFALADAESCRLLCCSLTEQGTHQVEEFDSFKNTLPEPEHMRAQTSAGTTHSVEEKERRFASEIIAWMQKRAEQHNVDHVVIFAPPRMLGVLRTVPLGSLKGRVEEVKGDLMRRTTGQLADHPLVRGLLTPAALGEMPAFDVAAINMPSAANAAPQAAPGRVPTAN